MEIPPSLKPILEKLGVNTTRLQWKLYEREKRKEAEKRGERKALPSHLRWMHYSHKFCPECKGIVARDEKVCPACGAKVPSMTVYRAMRTIGLMVPEGAALVVMTFIGVILAVYACTIFFQGPSAIMRPFSATLLRFGASDSSRVRLLDEYWRLFSFAVVHGGLIHIGFNTIALSQVGPLIEREIGSKRMLVLITVAQLTSALAFTWMSPYGRVVGASGWLFGLIGFGISYYHRAGGSSIASRNFLLQWAFYGFIFGLVMPGISNTTHVGGFLGGLALGLTADLTRARRTTWTFIWENLTWPCLIIWAVTLYYLARSALQI